MQTLKVKLEPTVKQAQSLLKTMHQFNAACNYAADVAFEHRCANKIKLQQIVYYPIREHFYLSSQMTVRAISKVVEAYKRDKTKQPSFKPEGAMIYDQRILSWKTLDCVSILTLDGRIKVPVHICEYHRPRMDRIRGQVDLIFENGFFYLAVVVDVPESEPIDPSGVIGVDLGINNLAADSDGVIYSGEHVDKVSGRIQKLRSNLQQCGSKSAKRHLKKLSKHESRYRRDVNHCISKELVTKAKDTSSIIALEDLEGITKRTRFRKSQRRRQHSWAFYQLRQFIEYKAVREGVPVALVDPAYTSQECPICHHISKSNRNGSNFICDMCGFFGHADHVAAINIAAKVAVNLPIVAGFFKHNYTPVTSPLTC